MTTKPKTLTEQVAQQLLDAIRQGVYPVGTRLPTGKQLAETYGVSPAVIREVTERLRAQGLIDSRQGAGVTVKARTPQSGFQVPVGQSAADLASVYELRLDLESTAAALAAVRHTDEDIRELEAILGKLETNLYHAEHGVEFDTAFHAAIARATHNRYYADLLQYLNLQIRQVVQAARTNTLRHDGLAAQVHQEHVAVFNAIKARDPLLAKAASLSHLLRASARLGLTLPGRDIITGAIAPLPT
ncbi:FadR/GntR family transcriptional regulator [Pandoraea anhela]|uniref:GntR family transcriptional regulator n=1 Tax=Pandoraea anhela TaxID=2508295 RepID=A0A5E4ZB62_9BURK|nr:FadR/GntR family transcriptional regulator [Pandoraea anhela]VVE57403.1 GntR family transcriptional regulator [Pandoraea anhela]